MTLRSVASRRYRLLCPIARTLDHVGDRWALLILRDVHAGPVRHKDLASGLTGIPSNVLATRLKELVADGLVQQTTSEHGASLYELTTLGEATGPLLFELSRFGTRLPADEESLAPGNLRLAAVTLKEALSRVAGDSELHVEIRIDGQPLDIQEQAGCVRVRYRSAQNPQAVISVPYEAMIAYGDGQIAPEAFTRHLAVEGDAEVASRFLQRLERAMKA